MKKKMTFEHHLKWMKLLTYNRQIEDDIDD